MTIGTADISSDGVYRYRLTREFARAPRPSRAQMDLIGDAAPALPTGLRGTIAWVMLNPSTADADVDDRTIAKVCKFSRMWFFRRVVVVNLHGYRATDPRAMEIARSNGVDIVGPDNDAAIARADAEAEMTVCAWGCWEGIEPARVERVGRLLTPAKVHCLTVTKFGAPGHPLYLPDYTEAQPWRVRPEERPQPKRRR